MKNYLTNEEQIENIMNNFDFNKVFRTMDTLNWSWAGEDGLFIPSVEELRTRARNLLNDLFERNLESIATGGFRVLREKDDTVTLMFNVSTWGSWEY